MQRLACRCIEVHLHAIGVEFELGEFTIVAPDRREDQASSEEVTVAEAPGMEVVV